MTLGNLAENYEFAALKSAGISLQRILLPLFSIVMIFSFAACTQKEQEKTEPEKTTEKKEVNEWWDSLEDYAQAYFNSEYGEPTFKDKENQLKFYDSLCCCSDLFKTNVTIQHRNSIVVMQCLIRQYPNERTLYQLLNSVVTSDDPTAGNDFYMCQKENNWDGAAKMLEYYIEETHRLKGLLLLFAEFMGHQNLKEKLLQIDTDSKSEDTPDRL